MWLPIGNVVPPLAADIVGGLALRLETIASGGRVATLKRRLSLIVGVLTVGRLIGELTPVCMDRTLLIAPTDILDLGTWQWSWRFLLGRVPMEITGWALFGWSTLVSRRLAC